MSYEVLTSKTFGEWLNRQKVTRSIKLIQLHHTAAPDYATWNKRPDALYWQKAMRDFHVNSRKFADIAQQFTICPDGSIVTGRSMNTNPAGITGGNSGAVCIECIGNFDSDTMTSAQREAVIVCVGELLKRFGLTADSGVTYHCWWTAGGKNLGDYDRYKSAKTCPGTGFFGGNTRAAYERGLMGDLVNYINGKNYNKGDLTMTQYEELKAEIAALKAKDAAQDDVINAVGKDIATLDERTGGGMVYDYIDENMPEWAREGVKWCADNGIICGDGEGLDLNGTKLWVLVVLYRAMKKVAKWVGVRM